MTCSLPNKTILFINVLIIDIIMSTIHQYHHYQIYKPDLHVTCDAEYFLKVNGTIRKVSNPFNPSEIQKHFEMYRCSFTQDGFTLNANGIKLSVSMYWADVNTLYKNRMRNTTDRKETYKLFLDTVSESVGRNNNFIKYSGSWKASPKMLSWLKEETTKKLEEQKQSIKSLTYHLWTWPTGITEKEEKEIRYKIYCQAVMNIFSRPDFRIYSC